MADHPAVRQAAQFALDVEARYFEGTRTRADVTHARLVFADVLEIHRPRDWRRRARQMHVDRDPEHELGVYYLYKLRTYLGSRAIGRLGSSRRNHLVTLIPGWDLELRKKMLSALSGFALKPVSCGATIGVSVQPR